MTIIEREREQVDVERERRASVLEAAALEIEVRGWTQGRLDDSDGRVCVVGAIGYALGRTELRSADPQDFVGRAAGQVFGVDPREVQLPDWNDVCPDRTAEEVTFVLRWRAQEIRDGR